MQDQEQQDYQHALLARIATSLEITTTLQLLAIKYPDAPDRDAQLRAYRATKDTVQKSLKNQQMSVMMGSKALPPAAKGVDDAKAAQQAFELENPLIVRLDHWLTHGAI
ncbi:hypothetical protein LJR034_009041 [Caballeronia sp. LjRoot34]|uniref:hypothetical protein n=1 Tax=Caballeronia sp. LjRoot34 TaxID=3342325 RepID=UPI003ECE92CB